MNKNEHGMADQHLELIAREVHQAWARLRESEGWTYGPQRDDTLKQHPGLVPYEDLEDSEREYDRETARQVLRAMKQLGYEVKDREGQRVI